MTTQTTNKATDWWNESTGTNMEGCGMPERTKEAQLEKLEDFVASIAAAGDEVAKPIRIKAQIVLCEVRGMESHFEKAKKRFLGMEPA